MNTIFLAALLLLSTAARAEAVDVSAVKALILDNMEAVGLVGGSVQRLIALYASANRGHRDAIRIVNWSFK